MVSTGTTKKKYKLSTERNKALAMFQKVRKLQECSGLGYVKCISCGKVIPVSEADGGHFIPRQYRATELLPTNVNPQCRVCNRFDYGNQLGYKDGLIERYGIEEEQRLENLFKAQKGSTEAYNKLSDEDKQLVFKRKTALEYHEEYLKYNKLYQQLKEREI